MSLDLTELSDGELATLSIAGRQAAFAEIVRRYRQPIFRLSRAFVEAPADTASARAARAPQLVALALALLAVALVAAGEPLRHLLAAGAAN